jgi:hypothetical protein
MKNRTRRGQLSLSHARNATDTTVLWCHRIWEGLPYVSACLGISSTVDQVPPLAAFYDIISNRWNCSAGGLFFETRASFRLLKPCLMERAILRSIALALHSRTRPHSPVGFRSRRKLISACKDFSLQGKTNESTIPSHPHKSKRAAEGTLSPPAKPVSLVHACWDQPKRRLRSVLSATQGTWITVHFHLKLPWTSFFSILSPQVRRRRHICQIMRVRRPPAG